MYAHPSRDRGETIKHMYTNVPQCGGEVLVERGAAHCVKKAKSSTVLLRVFTTRYVRLVPHRRTSYVCKRCATTQCRWPYHTFRKQIKLVVSHSSRCREGERVVCWWLHGCRRGVTGANFPFTSTVGWTRIRSGPGEKVKCPKTASLNFKWPTAATNEQHRSCTCKYGVDVSDMYVHGMPCCRRPNYSSQYYIYAPLQRHAATYFTK